MGVGYMKNGEFTGTAESYFQRGLVETIDTYEAATNAKPSKMLQGLIDAKTELQDAARTLDHEISEAIAAAGAGEKKAKKANPDTGKK